MDSSNEAADVFGSSPFDGILGMGPAKAAVDQVAMPMAELVEKNRLSRATPGHDEEVRQRLGQHRQPASPKS